MRTAVGVGLLLIIPVLAGCSLFRDKRNDSAKGNGASGSRPFTGSPASGLPERAERTEATTTSVPNGILAGYIVDRFDRPMPNAFIQVVDLSDVDGKAKLDVAADSRGQFAIPRLATGHTYKLIARVKDGTRFMAGAYQATASNPKIAIVVSEDLVDKDTPPLPGPLGAPVKVPEGTEKEKEKEKDTKPAAGLGTPIRTDSGDTGTKPQPPVVTPGRPVDRTNVVDNPDGGFRRVKPDAPDVNIRTEPEKPIPPPPPRSSVPREERSPLGPPMTPKSDAESSTTTDGALTPVPSCVLVGKKLENFALFDLDGKPWEYRKERKGRLVLLQFWSSTSPECLAGLKDTRDLQAKYGSFGLQVVGIAYEKGTRVQQEQNVRSARGRYLLNYVTLLGGGGQGSCPVSNQFVLVIDKLPELVLLDEDGQIIWRSNGAPDADRLWELRKQIKQRLGIKEP